ncbi:MAG: CRISPR-associated endonuclease Cas1 [bacterium]
MKEDTSSSSAQIIPFPNSTKLSIPEHPLQYQLFSDEPKILPLIINQEVEEELRVSDEIMLARTGDASQLILSGFGLFLSKADERLLVRKGKDLIYEFPFYRLSEVTIASKGVTISSDLIMELCERGVQINFLSGTGKPYAKITAPALSATIQARREQLKALDDERGISFARAVVAGKLANQRKLLLYFGKYMKEVAPERFQALIRAATSLKQLEQQVKDQIGDNLESFRNTLMGIEGSSSRIYWEGVQLIIEERVTFFGRVHRGATDAVNAMLNYGYGILYSQVWGAVMLAGLEPFAGFLHVDRPGKPSLVLDLVEEFRQPVVDRTVIAHINRGEAIKMEGGLLDAETRKSLSQKILERLETKEPYQGKKYQIRSIIQIQARNLAAFLRGEREYRPFSFKW